MQVSYELIGFMQENKFWLLLGNLLNSLARNF